MKTLCCLIILGFFASCQFSTYSNFSAGLTITEQGLTADQVLLNDGELVLETTNFLYGQKAYVNINGIDGLNRVDGKIEPGLSVTVVNENNDTLIYSNDIDLGDSVKLLKKNVSLRAFFIAAFSYKNGEKYTAVFSVWDKIGTGRIDIVMPFTVRESAYIQSVSEGIEYDAIYFWNQKRNQLVKHSKVSMVDGAYFIIEGLSGFDTTGGVAYPSLQVSLIDAYGDIIMQNDSMLQPYALKGMDPRELGEQIVITLSFSNPGIAENPVSFLAVIQDTRSDKFIRFSSDMKFE